MGDWLSTISYLFYLSICIILKSLEFCTSRLFLLSSYNLNGLAQLDDAVGGVISLAQGNVGIDQRSRRDQTARVKDSVAAALGVIAHNCAHFG